MSYYAALGDSFAGDVASNGGMKDFAGWIDTLDPDDYPCLAHLREYGWSRDLPCLAAQLAEAIRQHATGKSAKSVAEGILGILNNRGDAEVLVISDGVG